MSTLVAQIVTITPVATYKPGELIKNARLAAQYTQDDVAEFLKVDRSLISQIENGRSKKPLDPEKTNVFAQKLHISPLILLEAMGYDLGFESAEGELAAILPQAYEAAGDRAKEIVRLALGLERRRDPS